MTTGDSIILTGLRVRAHHGVYDFERENGQDFLIDLTVGVDLSAASTSDDVTQTIHYGELAERNPAFLAQFDSADAAAERVS